MAFNVAQGVEKVTQEHQKVISEKDMQVALLDDDLTDAQQSVVILEHDRFGTSSPRLKDSSTRAVHHFIWKTLKKTTEWPSFRKMMATRIPISLYVDNEVMWRKKSRINW